VVAGFALEYDIGVVFLVCPLIGKIIGDGRIIV